MGSTFACVALPTSEPSLKITPAMLVWKRKQRQTGYELKREDFLGQKPKRAPSPPAALRRYRPPDRMDLLSEGPVAVK